MAVKRILVVDDEPTICEVIADTLRDAGYRVDTAPNGAEALHQMRQQAPHALVVDLMMPRLDAQGLVELMRLSPRLSSIPILVVTASYGAAEAAKRLGARGYLTKPFELDDLVEMVRRMAGEPVVLPGASGAFQSPIIAEA